jgi:predicted TIM-barrel fold metal-dependent hydrolase
MVAQLPYAGDRTIFDADSHIMELPDWLPSYADPSIRDRLRPLYLEGAGRLAEDAVAKAEARRGDEAAARALEAEVLTKKGWHALGAFDADERSRALDLLGFGSQLVFSTFAATQYASKDAEVFDGGLRAHNRAIADFCSRDGRLVAVGQTHWSTPERAQVVLEEALDLGCGAILVPSHPGKAVSPTHPDYDRFWSTLEERGVPFMLHIGGGGRALKQAFHDNGRPTTDFLGGGENVRAKDYMTISQVPEQFLSAMVFDGVLEAHPNLRGGCIEQGAMWVVPWLRRLDICQGTFRKTEPTLQALPERASDYVHRQLWFTPFPTEPIGWMTQQCGDDLFLFSSDYPHPEGTKNPIERFEATMDGMSAEQRDRFYCGNYADMMGPATLASRTTPTRSSTSGSNPRS